METSSIQYTELRKLFGRWRQQMPAMSAEQRAILTQAIIDLEKLIHKKSEPPKVEEVKLNLHEADDWWWWSLSHIFSGSFEYAALLIKKVAEPAECFWLKNNDS